jgi:hypothetical protein
MDADQWRVCADPQRMLRFLLATDAPRIQDVDAFPGCRASDRQLRLFACACFGRLRHRLTHCLAWSVIEVAERYADGQATAAELRPMDARRGRVMAVLEGPWRAARGAARTALETTHAALALAGVAAWAEAPKAAWYASSNAYHAAADLAKPGSDPYDPAREDAKAGEKRAQADLLRCIVGPDPTAPGTTLLASPPPRVAALAQGVYATRDLPGGPLDPAGLGVLADAAEEAGCLAPEAVGHLRQPGPHVRGCHALDAALALWHRPG